MGGVHWSEARERIWEEGNNYGKPSVTLKCRVFKKPFSEMYLHYNGMCGDLNIEIKCLQKSLFLRN